MNWKIKLSFWHSQQRVKRFPGRFSFLLYYRVISGLLPNKKLTRTHVTDAQTSSVICNTVLLSRLAQDVNFREGQAFDIAVIPMASATTTTSFNLNPVGEGYKKTARGDERELLSEGELFGAQEINVHCL